MPANIHQFYRDGIKSLLTTRWTRVLAATVASQRLAVWHATDATMGVSAWL
jgi:hypothetical protein